MEYLTYIDDFTYAIFWFSFWIIFVIALVYWLAKWFAWFLNNVMELKKTYGDRKIQRRDDYNNE